MSTSPAVRAQIEIDVVPGFVSCVDTAFPSDWGGRFSMAIDDAPLRSRRAVLTASVAGLAAWFAGALGRPADVRAGTDGDVVLGAANDSDSTTSITNTTNSETVFEVSSSEDGSTAVSAVGDLRGLYANGEEAITAEGGLYGVRATGSASGVVGNAAGNGHSGVFGWSDSGMGVKGQSDSDLGVFGTSDTGNGILGTSHDGIGIMGASSAGPGVVGSSGSQTQPGVFGSSAATGVFGATGDLSVPALPQGVGVYGYAADDANAVGVFGRSTVGTGVHARADTAGTALRVTGQAVFSRSGTVNVAAGSNHGTKSVAGLTSASLVFAVVRSGNSGVWVRKVSPSSGKFTVYLNKTAPTPCSLSWIAFG